MIGTKDDNDVATDFMIHHCTSVTYISNAVLGEAKQGVSLAANKPRDDGYCLVTVAQPVTVLPSMAQSQKSAEVYLLFYGSKSHIRPFVYFKSSDRLFTTQHEFQWKDEGMLNISGVCVVALLLRCQCALTYDLPECLAIYFDEKKYPTTGFMKAMRDSSVDLSKATLKASSLPSGRHHQNKSLCHINKSLCLTGTSVIRNR